MIRVNLNDLSTYQQVILYFTPIFTSIIWINATLVLVRIRYFEWRFEGISHNAKLQSKVRRKTFANTMDQGNLNFVQRAITKSADTIGRSRDHEGPSYYRTFTKELFGSNFSNVFSQRHPENVTKYGQGDLELLSLENEKRKNLQANKFHTISAGEGEQDENNSPLTSANREVQFKDLPKPINTDSNQVRPYHGDSVPVSSLNLETQNQGPNGGPQKHTSRHKLRPADIARSISIMEKMHPISDQDADESQPYIVKDPFANNLVDDEADYDTTNKKLNSGSHSKSNNSKLDTNTTQNGSVNQHDATVVFNDNPHHGILNNSTTNIHHDNIGAANNMDPLLIQPANTKPGITFETIPRNQRRSSVATEEKNQEENEALEQKRISEWRAKIGLGYRRQNLFKKFVLKLFMPWKWFGNTGRRNTSIQGRQGTYGTRSKTISNDSISNYLTWKPKVHGNSVFVELTTEQKEEMGGIEYRSLKLLLKVLLIYYAGFIILSAFFLAPWAEVTKQYHSLFESNAVNPLWWGIFLGHSAFNNVGFALTPDSLISFYSAEYILIITSFVMFVGYSGFPCVLRFVLWIMRQLTDPRKSIHESLTFLLEHPRRCFTLLFPASPTWWLLFINFLLYCTDLFFYIVLGLFDPDLYSMAWPNRVVTGIFQAASTRTSGFTAVNLATVHPAIQVSYALMMYISVFPIAMSMRHTNVYEEKSLGVYNVPESSDSSDSSDSTASSEDSDDETLDPSPKTFKNDEIQTERSDGAIMNQNQESHNMEDHDRILPRATYNLHEFNDSEDGLSSSYDIAGDYAQRKAQESAQLQHENLIKPKHHKKHSHHHSHTPANGSKVIVDNEGKKVIVTEDLLKDLQPKPKTDDFDDGTIAAKAIKFGESLKNAIKGDSQTNSQTNTFSGSTKSMPDTPTNTKPVGSLTKSQTLEPSQSPDGFETPNTANSPDSSKSACLSSSSGSPDLDSPSLSHTDSSTQNIIPGTQDENNGTNSPHRHFRHLHNKNKISRNRAAKLPRLDVPGLATSWGSHIQRQLSFDLWFLFIAFFLLCIVEGGKIGNDAAGGKIAVFDLFFETLSAYCTVGMSLGYQNTNPSLSAQFSILGKLIICLCLWRGRHRGLPYAVDRAVLLPSDLAQNDKDQEIRVASKFYTNGPEGSLSNIGPHMMLRTRSGSILGFGPQPRSHSISYSDLDLDGLDDDAETVSGSIKYKGNKQDLRKRHKLGKKSRAVTIAAIGQTANDAEESGSPIVSFNLSRRQTIAM